MVRVFENILWGAGVLLPRTPTSYAHIVSYFGSRLHQNTATMLKFYPHETTVSLDNGHYDTIFRQ